MSMESGQPSPDEEQKIREAALNLLRKDRDLNDDMFTPPGAIGQAIDLPPGGAEGSKVPAVPPETPPENSGSMALEVPTDV